MYIYHVTESVHVHCASCDENSGFSSHAEPSTIVSDSILSEDSLPSKYNSVSQCPICVEAFLSVLKMKFHLRDVHCIEFTKGVKRGRSGSETATMPAWKKRSRQTKDHDQDVKLDTWPHFAYAFVDETTKLGGKHGPGTSTPHLMSSDRSSPLNTSVTDEITDTTETPALSVYTDMFDKLDSRLHDE